jgi:hypothetical protein
LINAVRDALAPFGARITSQPLTPEVIVDAIDAGTKNPLAKERS